MRTESAGRFASHDRVRDHSPRKVNERVDLLLEAELLRHVDAPASKVARRITDLDYEWDIDRALMANFAVVGGMSFLAGMRLDKRWLYLFGSQMVFLLMHATAGWCPPTSLFRRLGFRTHREIGRERCVLEDLLTQRARDVEYPVNPEQIS